jgi:DNA-binding winged helix-turn-helix (wHTH) protein/class 3 adenylate cyclase
MIYGFGDYEVDTQRYELRRAGEPLKIEPQAFNVLAYLIEHHERTVTRQELLETLWPEQFTSEAVLSYCIMTARKAVGDSGRSQKVIKTLHGRGFRFIAPVEAHGPQASNMPVASVPEKPVPPEPQPPEHETVRSVTIPLPEAPPLPNHDPDADTRAVTVLCATLVTTTSLDEQLGFAGVQRLRQAFFTLAQAIAQPYHGTLQFFGADGILLLFGAPVACQDHARQAMQAAMELQRRLGEPYTNPEVRQTVRLALRMGLHTGPVAINRIPEDQRIASTQLGKTMHLAVWLQYLASPGTLHRGENRHHSGTTPAVQGVCHSGSNNPLIA